MYSKKFALAQEETLSMPPASFGAGAGGGRLTGGVAARPVGGGGVALASPVASLGRAADGPAAGGPPAETIRGATRKSEPHINLLLTMLLAQTR